MLLRRSNSSRQLRDLRDRDCVHVRDRVCGRVRDHVRDHDRGRVRDHDRGRERDRERDRERGHERDREHGRVHVIHGRVLHHRGRDRSPHLPNGNEHLLQCAKFESESG